MKDLIAMFKRDMATRGLSGVTITTYMTKLRSFEEFLDGRDPVLMNKNDIRDYIDFLRMKKIKTTTIATNLSTVSSFYEFLIFEGLIISNPVLATRKRYLKSYKRGWESETHRLISIEEAAKLISSLVDIRDKTFALLLFKTGIRRNELLSLDVNDINWEDHSILLKTTKKRTNRRVYFDHETAYFLKRWLAVRKERAKNGNKALFISNVGKRLSAPRCNYIIQSAAKRIGLHDSNSDRMEDHFSPHCCRHWFTTHLRRAGMPREFIQELRGDVRKEAIDIYDHIDLKELKECYLAHIPQLGI